MPALANTQVLSNRLASFGDVHLYQASWASLSENMMVKAFSDLSHLMRRLFPLYKYILDRCTCDNCSAISTIS